MSTQSKAEILYIEAYDKKDSGFVMDGTENTPFREAIDAPSTLWIPSSGVMGEMKDGRRQDLRIRWINGCDELDPEIQDKRGFKPDRYNDKIVMEKGFATIINEGSTAGLYNYLKKVYYSSDAPNRPKNLTPLYKIMQIDKIAEEISDHDELVHDAMTIVLSLRVKTGTDTYKYNEERIAGLCEILQIGGGDGAPTKLRAITSFAKAKPEKFLTLVSNFENTIFTELTQALQNGVIKFEGNTCLYADDGGKIIRALGQGNFNQQAKLEKVADFMKTKEGTESLTELRAKVQAFLSKKL